jgi:hypothetical protein
VMVRSLTAYRNRDVIPHVPVPEACDSLSCKVDDEAHGVRLIGGDGAPARCTLTRECKHLVSRLCGR